jgi:nucleoside-diphosphate-sugar epimerase
MKIAITGGTGFVGNHLAKSLTDEGHKVISIARGLDQRNAHVLPKDLIEYRAIGTSNEEEFLRRI